MASAALERKESETEDSVAEEAEDDIFQTMTMFDSVWWRLTNLHISVTGHMTHPHVFTTGLILFLASLFYWHAEIITLKCYKRWFYNMAIVDPDKYTVTQCTLNCSMSDYLHGSPALEEHTGSLGSEWGLGLGNLTCNNWGACVNSDNYFDELIISEDATLKFIQASHVRAHDKLEPKLAVYSQYASYIVGLNAIRDSEIRFRAMAFRNFHCRLKFLALTVKGMTSDDAKKFTPRKEHCIGTSSESPDKCYNPKFTGDDVEARDKANHVCSPDDVHWDPRRCFRHHGHPERSTGILFSYLRYYEPHRVIKRWKDPIQCNKIRCCRLAFTFPWTEWSTAVVSPNEQIRHHLPFKNETEKTKGCERTKATEYQRWVYRRRDMTGMNESVQLELWEGLIEAQKCPVCFWVVDLRGYFFNNNITDYNKKYEKVSSCLGNGTGNGLCPVRLYTLLHGQLHGPSAFGHLAYTRGYTKNVRHPDDPNDKDVPEADYSEDELFCDHSKYMDVDVDWAIYYPKGAYETCLAHEKDAAFRVKGRLLPTTETGKNPLKVPGTNGGTFNQAPYLWFGCAELHGYKYHLKKDRGPGPNTTVAP